MYEDTYMGFMSEFSGKDIEEVREDLDRGATSPQTKPSSTA